MYSKHLCICLLERPVLCAFFVRRFEQQWDDAGYARSGKGVAMLKAGNVSSRSR
jgi:hypothetical protein